MYSIYLERDGHFLAPSYDHRNIPQTILDHNLLRYLCPPEIIVDPMTGRQVIKYERLVGAGLLPVLGLLFGDEKLTIDFDTSFGPLCSGGGDDPWVAAFVAGHGHGLIRFGRTVDETYVLGQIATAFPQARIAILSAHQDTREKITQGLRRSLPRGRVKTRIPEEEGGNHVLVSNFSDPADGPFEKYDVVILPDACHVTHQRASFALTTVDARFRLFGMLPIDRRLSPSEELSLMAAFGPATHVIPAIGRRQIPMATFTINLDRMPRLALGLRGVALQRQGVWRHLIRNRLLAGTARGLAAADVPQIPVTEWLDKSSPPNVTVLVANLEQALAIAPRLKGWPVLAGENTNLRGMSPKEQRLFAERTSLPTTGRRQIVTVQAAPSLEPVGDHVVLWAGGGPCAAPLPQGWLSAPTGSNDRLLLVDAPDRHHPQLADWARAREHAHLCNDWFAIGTDPERGRCQRFLVDQWTRSQHR